MQNNCNKICKMESIVSWVNNNKSKFKIVANISHIPCIVAFTILIVKKKNDFHLVLSYGCSFALCISNIASIFFQSGHLKDLICRSECLCDYEIFFSKLHDLLNKVSALYTMLWMHIQEKGDAKLKLKVETFIKISFNIILICLVLMASFYSVRVLTNRALKANGFNVTSIEAYLLGKYFDEHMFCFGFLDHLLSAIINISNVVVLLYIM